MYIRKQRLLTPGPTPLYPPALHAMMASDVHHRTEDFRKSYRSCLADLKEVMGTANDLLMFAASGTGAMDATVSNLLSKGDKVIVCTAGKFGDVPPSSCPEKLESYCERSTPTVGRSLTSTS